MRGLAICVVLLCACLSGQEKPLIREEQTVVVDGVSEVWRLEWRKPPQPACPPVEDSLTCPCNGFAYGEGGDLYLVRVRRGTEYDRLHLTPLFENPEQAVLQRWPTDDKDLGAASSPGFAEEVAKRPIVKVMQLADYDHDGRATEFLLTVENLACGHQQRVLIGLSRQNPRLHAFGTVLHPDKPLEMRKGMWEALRNAKSPVTVLDVSCGDHGSDGEGELQLRFTPRGIDVKQRNYACIPDGKRGRLLSESPL